MSGQLQFRMPSLFVRLLLIAFIAVAFAPPASAAPVAVSDVAKTSNQTPGWMTQDIVDRLTAVGSDVLAPSYLPGAVPFLPSVDAWAGYYSLYWLVPGTPPTYLQVTGTVGGSIPAYSKYDRNVQLTQNATVLGYPAWHDLTPIYDLVYFQVGSIVFTVESNNLGESSLGIANSMTWVDIPVYQPEPEPQDPGGNTGGDSGGAVDDGGFTQPDVVEIAPSEPAIILPESVISGQTIVIGIQGIIWANFEASAGTFSLTGDSTIDGAEPSSFEWTAPETQDGRSVRFTLTDPSTGELIITETLRVEPIPDDQIPVTADELSCPVSIPMGSLAGIEIDGTGQLVIDASDGLFPDVGPNQTFAGGLDAEVPGTDVLPGVIRTDRNAWVFFEALEAPVEYTTYLFLQTWDGTTLLECGIQIVFGEAEPVYPDMDPQDGTGSVGGLGIAMTADVAEGTTVWSIDNPGMGFMPDGSVAALEHIPYSDGTTIDAVGTPEPDGSSGG